MSQAQEKEFEIRLGQLVQEINSQNPEERQRGIEFLIRLYDLSKGLHGTWDIDKRLKLTAQRLTNLLEVERVSIMLMDQKGKEFYIKVAVGMDDEVIHNTKVKFGEGIAGWVAQSGQALLMKDMQQDVRFSLRKGPQYYNNSFLVVPLRSKNRVIGLVNVSNKRSRENFTERDQRMLEFITDQLALVIEQSLQFQEAHLLAKAKVDFIAVAGHELRTPLTVIKEAISIVREGLVGPLNEVQQRFLDRTKNHADRLVRLVNELLSISKLESGQVALHRQLVNLEDLVTITTESFLPQASKKGIQLIHQIASGLPQIWADSDKLVQVLVNLLSNALKFTPKEGRVTVHVDSEPAGGSVVIRVEDTGCGIPQSELKTIFDRFKQLKSFVKEKSDGIGLGLAIAKEIVQMHGGQIWAESQLNKGSIFFAQFPVDARAHSTETETSTEAQKK